MCIVLVVSGAIFASLLFSYFYLALGARPDWPPSGADLPGVGTTALAAAAWVASSCAIALGHRALRGQRHAPLAVALVAAAVLAALANYVTAEVVAGTGALPDAHAYGATMHALVAWQTLHTALLALMGGYTLARLWSGRLDSRRRGSFDHTRLVCHYTAAQGVLILLVLQWPRIAG
jgi:cytochrome c oxidase subunit I+III